MQPTARAGSVLLLIGVLASGHVARAGQPSTRTPDPGGDPGRGSAPVGDAVKESAAERRAVRGVALDDDDSSEAPELREVRRFEEATFPRGGGPMPELDPDEVMKPLPPGLTGRWGGSGDIPRELRSPENPAPAAARAAATRPDWAGNLNLPELPVRWSPQLIRYLDFFRSDSKGRAIMASWLRKMERFRASFEAVLARQGVPTDLIYLAMIESGFETGATSSRSAGGVWQFMPTVARAYGLEVSYWVDARRDPERSAEAAARYLKDLYVRFGSWHLAFAAYNAGYGAILRSITRYNTNDFWELCRHEAGLPWETTLYVPKILAAAIIGHNRKAFGFAEVAPDGPWSYDRIEVPPGTAFANLAKAAGARPEVIEALNPELVRGRTPPDRGPSQVRIPVGTAALYNQAASSLRVNGEKVELVTLRFGDTLDGVAKTRGVSARELRRLNGVSDSAELRGGTVIVVPARSGRPAPTVSPSPDEPEDVTLVAVPDRAVNTRGRDRVFYRTREGDTLADIAGVFDVTTDELVEWNNIDPAAKLQPKLVLQLFVREDFDRANVALLDPDKVRVVTLGSEEFLELEAARRGKTRLQYTARPGDTLAKIARRYGLAPGDLARINRLSSNSELAEGQRVVVYSPTPELPREITVGRTVPPKRPEPPVRPGMSKSPPAPSKSAQTKTALVSPPRTPAGKPGVRPMTPVSRPVSSPGRPAVASHSAASTPVRPGRPAVPARPATPAPAVKKPAAKH